jgi:NarL family two-component system response regulator LiaR
MTAEAQLINTLTAREREVLSLVADGKRDQEIASSLCISRTTASNHVSHILRKLQTQNRTAAAALATRARLLN